MCIQTGMPQVGFHETQCLPDGLETLFKTLVAFELCQLVARCVSKPELEAGPAHPLFKLLVSVLAERADLLYLSTLRFFDASEHAGKGGLVLVEPYLVERYGTLRGDKNLQLTVRLGVHTGLVVAGEMGGGETVEPMAIVGETPNIAARLQEVAEPNALVISDITRRLIEGFFL